MAGETFKIYTLGCKVNQYDSGELGGRFKAAGLKAVLGGADLAVVNSCAVTRTAMAKSRRMIARARKENPGAEIVLAGCWAKIDRDIKKEEIKADRVIFEKNIEDLAQKILCRTGEGIKAGNCGAPGAWSRSRYFLKIQDGCEQFCTYCVIPYARGKLSSEPAEKVLSEIEEAVRRGYKEVILCGIHLGLYCGLQIANRFTNNTNDKNIYLIDLLKEILKTKGLGRVRLSSIELNEVSDGLISLLVKKRVPSQAYLCRHLHIPLQSGCDKILKLMNRPYTTGQFSERLTAIRKIAPQIAITTDVICGFPGETEEDFETSFNFIKKQKFSRLHVFPFSAHEKTPAAKMLGQVSDKAKKARASRLRKLGRELEADYKAGFKGRELEAVAERISGGRAVGKTEFYFDVEAEISSLDGKEIKCGEMFRAVGG